MAITQRTGVNPQTMAANWTKGVAAAGSKWLTGIENPRALPNANPQQNAQNWLAGVEQAQPAYIAGVSSPNYLTRLDAGAKAKQGSYTGAAQTHAADFASSAQRLAPMIQQALSNLPPKGPKGTNTQRSTAFQEAMHAQKGQGKKQS
jgi:hypothetical protein